MAPLTIAEVAERYRVTRRTVSIWVENGELTPLHVGTQKGKQKPRYRFTEQALADFEKLRTDSSPEVKPRRRRRRRQPQMN